MLVLLVQLVLVVLAVVLLLVVDTRTAAQSLCNSLLFTPQVICGQAFELEWGPKALSVSRPAAGR